MIGLSSRVVLAILLLTTSEVAAQRAPVFDPQRLLSMGDLDLDGRLSLDGYRNFLRAFARTRNASATIDPMFRRLDTDHDGFLSLSEYRKSFPSRPMNATAKPGPLRAATT